MSVINFQVLSLISTYKKNKVDCTLEGLCLVSFERGTVEYTLIGPLNVFLSWCVVKTEAYHHNAK